MERTYFCHSCTMIMENPGDHGTEQDGNKSDLYCKYCYDKGHFIHPGITLEQMKDYVLTRMNKLGISENIIHLSLTSMPHLKRWKNWEQPVNSWARDKNIFKITEQ